MELGYMMFMAEAEGNTTMVDTRLAKVNSMINAINNSHRYWSSSDLTNLMHQCGLTYLTGAESAYISSRIS